MKEKHYTRVNQLSVLSGDQVVMQFAIIGACYYAMRY